MRTQVSYTICHCHISAQWVHMQVSILTECEVSHSKYHNFWTTASISVKKLQNVALVAGFNLHLFSSLKSQKRKFNGHFTGAHLLKKNSNIWKYQEMNISCVHILELYIFPWRVQTVTLDYAWRLKYMYLGWLKHGGTGTILNVNYRHRSKFIHSNVLHKVYEYTAVHMSVLYMFPPEVCLVSMLP